MACGAGVIALSDSDRSHAAILPHKMMVTPTSLAQAVLYVDLLSSAGSPQASNLMPVAFSFSRTGVTIDLSWRHALAAQTRSSLFGDLTALTSSRLKSAVSLGK